MWIIKWIARMFLPQIPIVIPPEILVGFTSHAQELIKTFAESGYSAQPEVVSSHGETYLLLINWKTGWVTRICQDGSCMEFRPENLGIISDSAYIQPLVGTLPSF